MTAQRKLKEYGLVVDPIFKRTIHKGENMDKTNWKDKTTDTVRPAMTFRVEDCSASIWKNAFKKEDGTSFFTYSVTFERYYKDKSGKDCNSQSFGKKDLIKLSMLIDKTSTWLYVDKAGDE
jgi:hypothetical protein